MAAIVCLVYVEIISVMDVVVMMVNAIVMENIE
jgi:hypothetical protein